MMTVLTDSQQQQYITCKIWVSSTVCCQVHLLYHVHKNDHQYLCRCDVLIDVDSDAGGVTGYATAEISDSMLALMAKQ